jgi:uncharacterized repeat protein (TIGR01451 family)
MESRKHPSSPHRQTAADGGMAALFLGAWLVAALSLLALAAQRPAPAADGAPFGLIETYDDPIPNPSAEFGNAVGFLPGGNEFAVAARSDTLGGADPSGAVWLRQTAGGAVVHELTRTVTPTIEYFGYSLAMSGTAILVGSPHDEVAGTPKAGSAYLFDLYTGSVITSFSNPAPTANDGFGWSTAILSDTAVLVGEPYYEASVSEHDVGRAYVCVIADGACPTAIEKPNDVSGNDNAFFGYSVISLGDQFAVAAPFGGTHGYVYVFDTATDTLNYTITLATATNGDNFGSALALVNGDLLIGAQNGGPNSSNNPGAAYIYSPDGTLLKTFNNPDSTDNGAGFGAAVASDGTYVLIGAPRAAGGQGRAYLFDLATGAYIQTFQAPSPGSSDNFGSSVAVQGENFLVGAPGRNAATTGGAAYRFGVVPANFSASAKTVNATLVRPGGLLTYTLTLSNTGTVSATFALTDTLDAHVSLISAPGMAGSSTLTATGILSGNTQLTYTVTLRASQPYSGTVANTAHLSGDGTLRGLTAPLVTVVNRLWLPVVRRP